MTRSPSRELELDSSSSLIGRGSIDARRGSIDARRGSIDLGRGSIDLGRGQRSPNRAYRIREFVKSRGPERPENRGSRFETRRSEQRYSLNGVSRKWCAPYQRNSCYIAFTCSDYTYAAAPFGDQRDMAARRGNHTVFRKCPFAADRLGCSIVGTYRSAGTLTAGAVLLEAGCPLPRFETQTSDASRNPG